MRLDNLSIFLRISHRYKRVHKVNTFIYSHQYLCKNFDCSEAELDGLIEKFGQFYCITVPHENYYL